eukprot:6172121-Pleurochrysis_carterae.AAC.2
MGATQLRWPLHGAQDISGELSCGLVRSDVCRFDAQRSHGPQNDRMKIRSLLGGACIEGSTQSGRSASPAA